MKLGKRFSSLLLAGTLITSLPIATMAKGPEKKVIDYVALGDSLAAGITPDGKFIGDYGYPHYLVTRFEQSQYTVGYDNLSFPGKTSGQLLNDVLTSADVQTKISEAEFITIDIGSNDLLPLFGSQRFDLLPSAIGTIAVNLNSILTKIDQLNPNTKVYVMGYYNPFPYITNLQPLIKPTLDNLNGTIEAQAIAHGDTYVPTEDIIAKHYEEYLPNPTNVHLSLEGYQIVAKEFWKAIDKSKN
ncbi:SGNH/GDSL hydrolase family protein [Bacillus sp. UNC438CL73TsuS30]|uniref:SGNH/GDSL hydrolase family protein n=1 Tax=Bacillus sp. UNC438CL73TsuS30 TaxID=1340434 RepID=UPI00047AD71E|nr:SGNH/GDSL hydrolase family protein [Bacillus sp. UNC438CL73TsuS30]